MAQFETSDFDIPNATPLGAGAISFVVDAVHHKTGSHVALKVLSKVQLLQQQKVQAAMDEKKALFSIGPHPHVARILGTMQSDDELYFALELLPHGDLLEHIRTLSASRRGVSPSHLASAADGTASSADVVPDPPAAIAGSVPCMTIADIKRMTAQIVVALEAAFAKGCALRDLKPENICFDSNMRCVLIDFDTVDVNTDLVPVSNGGVAVKPRNEEQERQRDAAVENIDEQDTPQRRKTISEIQGMRKLTMNFCGTAQYVSPEMIGQCAWSYSSDLWALGCVVYQMAYGVAPFDGANPFACMKEIIKGLDLSGERHFKRNEALESDAGAFADLKDFIARLVVIDPLQRLGVDSATGKFNGASLRQHPFLWEVDWAALDASVAGYRFEHPLYTPPAAAVTTEAASAEIPRWFVNYDDAPAHDKRYAEYVHKTGGQNPFEQFLEVASRSDGGAARSQEDEQSGSAEPQASAQPAAEGSSRPLEDFDDDEDGRRRGGAGLLPPPPGGEEDEEDDVIDDVGQRDRVYGNYQFGDSA